MTIQSQDTGGLQKARVFAYVSGALATAVVSIVLFIVVTINDRGAPNPLAMVTVLGAPFAYWLAWFGSPSRLTWFVSPVLFMAAILPASFGGLALYYLPSLLGLVVGTPAAQSRQTAESSG